MRVRVLADDLTGALDAGACFVGKAGPLPVRWRARVSDGEDSFVYDTETRALPRDAAIQRVTTGLRELAAADIAFKKIDSLLRGNSVEEIAHCARWESFSSLILAPAFPAQRRRTRAGQQYVQFFEDGDWQPAGPNLLAALSDRFAPQAAQRIDHVPTGARPEGRGVFVCDAETDRDLLNLAGMMDCIDGPILWCGTAGLARALGGEAILDPPKTAALLAITSSRHAVARSQVARLAQKRLGAVVSASVDAAGGVIAERLSEALSQGVAVLTTDYPDMPAAQADQLFERLLAAALADLPRPGVCLVIGGVTLRLLLDVLGAERLVVEGEITPGLPLSHVKGGAWPELRLVTMAGAFGTPATLTRLVQEMVMEAPR